MTSDHTSCAAGFQRQREDNLTVLLLKRLRHRTPTAEEATRNSRPRARASLAGSGLLPGLYATQPGRADWHCCNRCHSAAPPARACSDCWASLTQGRCGSMWDHLARNSPRRMVVAEEATRDAGRRAKCTGCRGVRRHRDRRHTALLPTGPAAA